MGAVILHLIGQLGRGGAEKQLFLVCEALQQRGWRQHVVSFSQGGVWKDKLEDAGVPVYEILPCRFTPWRFWQLYCYAKKIKPHLVLSWSPHLAVYAQWINGVRRIANVRGDLTINSNHGGYNSKLRWYCNAIQKADLVVSNSLHGIDALVRAGLTIQQSEVVRNIVPAYGRAKPADTAAIPRIAAVGSLKQLKAYDVLLRALSQVAKAGGKFELLLAGSGPDKENLENLAMSLDLADHVKFLGDVEDVPGLLATTHLFVHPSTSESLCNAILEAMAEGLPVIASRVGGNTEIVADEQSGLLVAPGSPDELAAAIRRLLDDASLREQFGRAGLLMVRNYCGEAGVVDQYESIFFRLLSSCRSCGEAMQTNVCAQKNK